MIGAIDSFNLKEFSGREARLWQEWKDLDNLCNKRKAASKNPRKPSLSYVIRKRSYNGLPIEFEIWYRVKSIVGVKDMPAPREPIFGYLHKMSIVLPNNYPSADGNPIFTFRTDVWHPNIRYSGSFKGHVCLHQGDGSTGVSERLGAACGALLEIPALPCPEYLSIPRRPNGGRVGTRRRRA